MEASSEQGHITKSLDPHSAVCQSQWGVGGGYLINVPPKSNLNDKICCFFLWPSIVLLFSRTLFLVYGLKVPHTQ